MKKTLKVDLCFVGALLVVILGVPIIMSFSNYPPWERNLYAYMFRILPYPCIAIALLHVIITKRISGLFIFSEIIFLLLGGIYREFYLWPQDSWGDILIDGLIIGMLLMFIPMITFLLQAFGIFIVGLVERRKAKKNQPGS